MRPISDQLHINTLQCCTARAIAKTMHALPLLLVILASATAEKVAELKEKLAQMDAVE